MNAIKGSGPVWSIEHSSPEEYRGASLLDLTHGELVGYLQVHGQPWREDESNEDISYLRNYVRHRVCQWWHSVMRACVRRLALPVRSW
ncbi:MAG: ATP-binding protein [Collinsella sp.]